MDGELLLFKDLFRFLGHGFVRRTKKHRQRFQHGDGPGRSDANSHLEHPRLLDAHGGRGVESCVGLA